MKTLIYLLNLSFFSYSFANEDLLELHYVIRPPYFIGDSKSGDVVSGNLYNIIKKVMQEAKIGYTFVNNPFPRSVLAIQENKRKVCIPSAFKTEERLKFSYYSKPIFRDKQHVVIIRSDDMRIKNGKSYIDILKNNDFKILVKLGYSYGIDVDKNLKEIKGYDALNKKELTSKTLKYTSLDNISMLKMIIGKEADYMFIGGNEADYLFKINPDLKMKLKTLHLKEIPEGETRHFFCSKIVGEGTMKKIDTAIAKVLKL